MKYLVQVLATIGMVFLMSGCFASSQSQMNGMSGGTCNNSKCQCPKPCECGSGCKCGMNGNSNKLNGK